MSGKPETCLWEERSCLSLCTSGAERQANQLSTPAIVSQPCRVLVLYWGPCYGSLSMSRYCFPYPCPAHRDQHASSLCFCPITEVLCGEALLWSPSLLALPDQSLSPTSTRITPYPINCFVSHCPCSPSQPLHGPLSALPPCLQFEQFSSVQSCPTLWDPMNHSTPGLPVHHQLLEFT